MGAGGLQQGRLRCFSGGPPPPPETLPDWTKPRRRAHPAGRMDFDSGPREPAPSGSRGRRSFQALTATFGAWLQFLLPVVAGEPASAVSTSPDPAMDDPALAQLLAEALPTAWSTSGSVRAGGGYRDNILLSAFKPVGAGLVTAGGDFLLSRAPTDGTEVAVLASGDYTHFVDEPAVEPEAMALAQAEVKRELGRDWRAGLRTQYIFLHQVFDVSATEADLSTVTARGHTLLAAPALSRELGRGWRAEAAVEGSRQLFEAPLDNYWEAAPAARFTHELGARGDVGGHYRFLRRWYDDRSPLDASGGSLPGKLEFDSHEVELRARLFWDPDRRWSTQIRLGVLENTDNGGGYFDYVRYGAGLQLKYRTGPWSLRAEVRARWYDYRVQVSGAAGSDPRDKTDVNLLLRGDYRLGQKWTLFAQYDRESTTDTLPDSSYDGTTVVAGVELEL